MGNNTSRRTTECSCNTQTNGQDTSPDAPGAPAASTKPEITHCNCIDTHKSNQQASARIPAPSKNKRKHALGGFYLVNSIEI